LDVIKPVGRCASLFTDVERKLSLSIKQL